MKMKHSEKRNLTLIMSIAYASGVALYLLSRFIRVQTEVGEQHHAAEHTVRFIHATLTYFVIMGLGFVIKSHVLPGLKSKSNRGKPTGITLLAIFGTLLTTALGILYLGDGDWQSRVSFVHAYVGLSLPLVFLVHLLKRKIS